MKQHGKIFSTWEVQAILDKKKTMFRELVKPHALWAVYNKEFVDDYSPYLPGDIIYVRETYRRYWVTDPETGEPDFDHVITEYATSKPDRIPMLDGDGFSVFNKDGSERFIPWRSPATMPREAARIFLKVKSVRVERLQEITQEQAGMEGVWRMPHRCPGWENPLNNFKDCFRCAFKVCWNNKYGPSGLTWESNPYVWVYEFELTDKPK